MEVENILRDILLFTLILETILGNQILTKGDIITSSRQSELIPHVHDLNGGRERAKMSVAILNRRHLRHVEDLKTVISKCLKNSQNNLVDECDRTTAHRNETFETKFDEWNLKCLKKLTALNNTTILDAVELNSSCWHLKTCKNSVQAKVKLQEFAEKLTQFENWQENLEQQQNNFKNMTETLMKFVVNIKEKLLANEQKFINFRRQLPDLNNFSNKISNLANWKHWEHRHLPRQ